MSADVSVRASYRPAELVRRARLQEGWPEPGGDESVTLAAMVVIVGLPSPAGCDPTRTWRAAAQLVATSLRRWYGDRVQVEYVELFSGGLERYPELVDAVGRGDLRLPIVMVDGDVVLSGDKLRVSVVREALESQGLRPIGVGAADARVTSSTVAPGGSLRSQPPDGKLPGDGR